MKSDKRVDYKFRAPPFTHRGTVRGALFHVPRLLLSASQEVVNEARNVGPTRAYEPTSHKSVKTREGRGEDSTRNLGKDEKGETGEGP